MRICQLELSNFRGVRTGRVVLPQHTVLLGANNAGKSTIVEALAILFGRDKMTSPISDWDFHGGSPKPDSRFYVVATITGFSSNDPTHIPDWFIGENAAQPVWWHEDTQTVSSEADPPDGTTLAARIAVAGRFDDEACEFEVLRYFYHGEADPFTDGCAAIPWRNLRDVGLFILSSNRDWDKLLSFRSSSLLKVIREYDALPGKAIDELKRQLREEVAKVEKYDPLSEILDAATKELQSFSLIGRASKMVYRPTALDSISVLQSLVAHVAGPQDIIIPVARQGAGTVSLQAFLLLLAFAKHRQKAGQSFILAAEEPELHLHPSLHQRLVHRIRGASEQSIVTTQSPQVAVGYQPQEVIFLRNVNGQLDAIKLRTEPIKSIPTNSIRHLYLTRRAAFCEALMGGVILVPEGQYDYEWLTLWQRLAQSSAESVSHFDLRPMTMLPTTDSAVGDSFRELARFRLDAVPVLDGDAAADGYLADLLAGNPVPKYIIRYGQDAAVECLSAWILEPSLAAPGHAVQAILDGKAATLRNLQDGLIDKKKDREAWENAVWECVDSDECCKRACQVLQDFAAIALGGTPANASWKVAEQANGTIVHVASHIQRL